MRIEAFREAVLKGERPADVSLAKVFISETVKALGERKFLFTISTGTVDRDGDRVSVEGWDTTNFMKAGGPVLLAHKHADLPVAKTEWVKAQSGLLQAVPVFAPEEKSHPVAIWTHNMVEFGALKAASVGFKPRDFVGNGKGVDFAKQELLEWSILPVPANPEAVMAAKSARPDLDPTPWIDLLESELAIWKGAPGADVQKQLIELRGLIEKSLTVLEGNRSSIVVQIDGKVIEEHLVKMGMGEGDMGGGKDGKMPMDMTKCAECGAPKKKGEKCSKCGKSEDAKGDEGKSAEPAVKKEALTTSAIMAERVERENAWKMRWDLRDAFTQSLDRIDAQAGLTDEERTNLTRQSVEEFVARWNALPAPPEDDTYPKGVAITASARESITKAIEKAGRVLSGKNEAHLREAMGHISRVLSAVPLADPETLAPTSGRTGEPTKDSEIVILGPMVAEEKDDGIVVVGAMDPELAQKHARDIMRTTGKLPD